MMLGYKVLEKAQTLEDDNSWAKIITLAEEIQGEAERLAPSARPFMKIEALLMGAEIETRPHRRKRIVERVKSLLLEHAANDQSLAGMEEKGASDLKYPEGIDLKIKILLDEDSGDALKRKIETLKAQYFEQLQTTENIHKPSCYKEWMVQILRLAMCLEDRDKFAWTVSKAREVERLKDGADVDGAGRYGESHCFNMLDSFLDALDTVVRQESNPERSRKILEISLADLSGLAIQSPFMEDFTLPLYYQQLAAVCLKLAALPGTTSGENLSLKSRAITVMEKMARLSDGEWGIPMICPDYDGRFIWAQALIQDSAEDRPYRSDGDTRMALAVTQKMYKKHFDDLLKYERNIYSPRTDPTDKHDTESFQMKLTPLVAGQMNSIYQNIIHLGINDAWSRIWLADIYRYLALSGMLLSHYRDLYFRRAENFLRQGLEMASAGQIDERAMGQAELGLLLLEKTLISKRLPVASEMTESRRLWASAEEIKPGASRYARARWAAWKGEPGEVERLINHGYSDALEVLFPDYEQAYADPAFSGVRDRHWFKKAWHGLEIFSL